ncbi:MAG: hypothetical protein COZ49_03765 [Candidatus Yonathbacteria bacterium CG_4_10_14_3_um_filter_47_65]|uniref:VTT domain-containing protein n=2 Tax=Parcubacteria group TaxID=1794811 RepID=A0A2M8D9T5_9BACT|nr:MAG: hypothetical protein AUJ44_04190 [Candidatus Nomurabacteria bacterium CG1_02_47_685]PIP04225.1 MAG: hypothetical protein COX54_00235 [Candidatus Yonathbacteria bacterium CG23_combo_of_CG06-09_8_20_14_all_46_18]PIQ31617.1 MAG: hypothetical protein COW61_03525 [Candidatus Yonathbacteria bacterium CG17_big_fil_post_rev_8_21_14_2_50_46_19]PIX56124.1 MAG: hypothetical protein COZ49_03765 [Candidatus Yonathbacteria bacterium CG_4_10_14_3_um_filter_47_65]PIY57696.1 MAG: hypothetical protein CO
MFESFIEHAILSTGYVAIFLLMILNGAISIPSSQLLYIITGYFISVGNLFLIPVVLCGAIGNTIGNMMLYEVARAKGLDYITRLKIFPKPAVRKAQVAFRKKGGWFAFVGKLLPAIKVFVPIPAGIAKMNRVAFTAIMFVASIIWTFPFIAIGYYFGKSANVLGNYALILFALAIVLVFMFYRYMQSDEVEREVTLIVPNQEEG